MKNSFYCLGPKRIFRIGVPTFLEFDSAEFHRRIERHTMDEADYTRRRGKRRLSHFERLERLRVVTGKTWKQIAEDLEVDRSMLFHVKAKARNLSSKVIFRIEKAEIAAGIIADAKTLIKHGLDAKELAAKLLDETTHHTGKITVSDVDRGFKDVSLDYRRGSPPSGYPSNIRLYAPGNRITWKIMGADGVLDDPTRLLLACMPKDRSNTDFLDLLTPPCYRVLVEIAIGLVFGFPRMERKK